MVEVPQLVPSVEDSHQIQQFWLFRAEQPLKLRQLLVNNQNLQDDLSVPKKLRFIIFNQKYILIAISFLFIESISFSI